MSLSPSCDERRFQKRDTGAVAVLLVVVVVVVLVAEEEVVVVVVEEGVALDEVVILRPFVTQNEVEDHTRRDKVGLLAQQKEGESKNVASIKKRKEKG